jgi:hypothetical protein
MKILRGNLTETRYNFPKGGDEPAAPMEVISEKTYTEDSVAYMADELGVHRIWNKGSDFAVSLHRRFLNKRRYKRRVNHGADKTNSVHPAQRSKRGMQHLRPEDGEEEPREQVWLLLRLWTVAEGVAACCRKKDEHGLRPCDDSDDGYGVFGCVLDMFPSHVVPMGSSSERVQARLVA